MWTFTKRSESNEHNEDGRPGPHCIPSSLHRACLQQGLHENSLLNKGDGSRAVKEARGRVTLGRGKSGLNSMGKSKRKQLVFLECSSQHLTATPPLQKFFRGFPIAFRIKSNFLRITNKILSDELCLPSQLFKIEVTFLTQHSSV